MNRPSEQSTEIDEKRKVKRRRKSHGGSEDESNLEDGYKWCKYGEKPRIDSAYIRSYYRCSNKISNCSAKKTVDRHKSCKSKVNVTYNGTHNHLPPAAKEVIVLHYKVENGNLKNVQQSYSSSFSDNKLFQEESKKHGEASEGTVSSEINGLRRNEASISASSEIAGNYSNGSDSEKSLSNLSSVFDDGFCGGDNFSENCVCNGPKGYEYQKMGTDGFITKSESHKVMQPCETNDDCTFPFSNGSLGESIYGLNSETHQPLWSAATAPDSTLNLHPYEKDEFQYLSALAAGNLFFESTESSCLGEWNLFDGLAFQDQAFPNDYSNLLH